MRFHAMAFSSQENQAQDLINFNCHRETLQCDVCTSFDYQMVSERLISYIISSSHYVVFYSFISNLSCNVRYYFSFTSVNYILIKSF